MPNIGAVKNGGQDNDIQAQGAAGANRKKKLKENDAAQAPPKAATPPEPGKGKGVDAFA